MNMLGSVVTALAVTGGRDTGEGEERRGVALAQKNPIFV